MAASTQDFDEYNKPGAERLRRRRGEEEEDDDLESDLEGELLEEDWLSAKKNPSEASDEELNDDLLQSDDEDINMCGQNVSLNASVSLGTSYDQGDHFEDAANDIVNLGTEDYEERNIEDGDYQEEGEDEYAVEYSQGNTTEEHEDQIEYTGELGEVDEDYQDQVLDIQINEPIDNEFQDDDFSASYTEEQLAEEAEQQEDALEERGEMEEKEELTPDGSQVPDLEEGDNEQDLEEEGKEESDEEDDDDEESGRLRFKTERKDVSVVRLADAESKRRNIPETLELSEEAKADLLEFEERERQKKMGRFGGRGRGGGGGGMGGWHGGARGRGGFPGFGMGDFRGDCGGRGRMNPQRLPLMTQIGMQAPSRMSLPHHQQRLHHQQQQQRHHAPGPRGPPPFQEHGGPLAQQPLQPLISPHMAHRSPPLRAQMEPPLRMLSPPPANHQQQQQQPPQPKNIHINPHFRGPASSPAQVPLMPPTPSQPRPAVGPQRFPGPGDFQQHMPSNFGQQQRPQHHMEPWRNQPPPPTQDRDTFFIGEPRFPGQHMFNHQSPAPLINNNNNLNQQHQLAGQGHMGFGHPGPGFNHSGSQLGLFQREPPRPSLPPQGHQGMAGLNQHGGAPNQPFMGSRQPFPQQQGNPFPPPQIQFGMQGLMHGPPPPQLQHHEPPSSHPPMHQQHHRPDLSQHRQQQQHQHQGHGGDQRPMMHHAQNPFHPQQMHGSPRQMPLNAPQRNPSNRPRMSPPASKQQMQILPQRNSNLRELPIAPGNPDMNNVHPISAPASNFRPVARAAQGVRPGQNVRPVPTGGRGRGQAVAKAASLPGAMERTVVRKEIPKAVQQDPDEDEETRQYRMKIEEQKRLREEILKKKELRRQMQAGMRKKELLERITGQGGTQGQNMAPSQNPAPPQPIPLQLQLQPSQQQRQFLPKPQQLQVNPQPGSAFPLGGTPQPPQPRPNVKTRLQMAKGGHQQPNNPGPGQNIPGQWQQQQQQQQQQSQQQNQQQQRRSNALQNPIRLGAQFQSPQAAIRSIPMQVASVVGPGAGQVRAQGAKPGVKRTVMQRSNSGSGDVLQVPQKVRVVKLLGGGGDMQDTSGPTPQQNARMTPQVCQSPLRKVTIANPMDQQPPGLGMANPVGPGVRGGTANLQNNRVVVSSRGRGRGMVGVGAGPIGRGRGMPTRQNQRSLEKQACTVSIDGLSSSTTDIQLKNLLNSIGPIQMFKMLPQQRRAIAKFASPQHALSFQVSFNRHMIDLSHIDVSLIDD